MGFGRSVPETGISAKPADGEEKAGGGGGENWATGLKPGGGGGGGRCAGLCMG